MQLLVCIHHCSWQCIWLRFHHNIKCAFGFVLFKYRNLIYCWFWIVWGGFGYFVGGGKKFSTVKVSFLVIFDNNKMGVEGLKGILLYS